MRSPDKALARLALHAAAAAGSLVTAGVVLATGGGVPGAADLRDVWCLIRPSTLFDWALHLSTVGAWALSLAMVVLVACTAARQWLLGARLAAATRAACLRGVPPPVSGAARAAGVAGHLDLIDTPRPVAFVYGWRRPRVCVSTGLIDCLTAPELEAVLHHERWHLVRRDPFRLAVVRSLTAPLRWSPAITRLAHQYQLATEVDADRYAVEAMGSRRALAGALSRLTSGVVAAGRVSFSTLVEARVAALLGDSSPGGRASRLALGVVVLEVVLIAFAATDRSAVASAVVSTHPRC